LDEEMNNSNLSEDDAYVLKSKISDTRKQKFLDEFIADRVRAGTIDKLFQQVRALQRRSGNGPPGGLGYNTLVPKGPFVDDSNWVELPTWDLAIGIESALARELETALRQATRERLGEEIDAEAQAIVQAADAMAEELRNAGYTPTLYVLVGRPSINLAVALTYLVKPDWELSGPLHMAFKILGTRGDVPILEVDEGDIPALYAVDLARFARLRRFGNRPEFALNEIDAQEGAEWLAENPALVKEPPPMPGLENERLSHLLLQAHLRLYEKHELMVLDQSAAIGRPVNFPPDE